MPDKEVILREFVYFDRARVEDFLSSVEDGLARERREIDRSRSGQIRAGVDAKIAKLEREGGF